MRWSGKQERHRPSGWARRWVTYDARRSSCSSDGACQWVSTSTASAYRVTRAPGRPSARAVVWLPPSESRSWPIALSKSSSLSSATSGRSSRKPSGSSRSAAVGSRSGWAQTASRASLPCRDRSEPQSAEASRSRRGRSSRPTRAAKVSSAGTSGSAAPTDRLLHLGRGRHPLGGRLADDLVDPALDEGERRLEPDQRGLLLGRLLGLEQAALQGLLHRLHVGRVELAHGLLDAGDVDGDAATEVLDGGDQVLAQPRDVGEQPLVRGLAQGQVEQHVVLAHVEAVGELRDVVRDQRGLAGRDRGGGRCRSR